jgi:fermentation-respiration switch protein FrsA (DUF1100 family)
VTYLVWIPAALLAVWLLLQGFALALLYPSGRRKLPAEPDFEGLEVEEVEFCAADGTALHGLWFPHPEAKGVLLVCHGNGRNAYSRVWIAKDLRDLPLHVFVFDYRGYGRSAGMPSERGTALDVAAAWEVVHERLGRPEDPPILLFGRSLGGAVALQLGPECPVRGLILESTFTSVLEIALRRYPWLLPRLTCRNPYRSDLRIHRVSAPVLMAHSPDDEVIPYDMGESLFRRTPHPWRFCVLEGGHEEAGWRTSPGYAAAVRAFAREVGVV